MIKAVTLKEKNNLELKYLNIPDNCENGIVIDVIACGICGTDKHLIDGKMKLDYPIIPGHELYGRISYIGKKNSVKSLNGVLKVGDLVTVLPGKSCGDCIYCKSFENSEELCTNRKTYGLSFNINNHPFLGGGYSEKVYLSDDFKVYHIPDNWPLGFGAILETMAVGVHATERALEKTKNAKNRKISVLILGAGAVGISVALSFLKKGADVVVLEPIQERQEIARKLGVKNTYSGIDDLGQFKQILKNVFNGLEPDIVVEATGEIEAFENALNLVRRGGTVLELGNFIDIGFSSIKPSLICRNEITIVGSALAPEACFFEAENILNSIIEKSDLLIAPIFKLEQYDDAIKNLRFQKKGLKAIFYIEENANYD